MDAIQRCGLFAAVMIGMVVGSAGPAAADGNELAAGFRSPPADARPWVYWFWSDGNMNPEGVTADLEAMHRVGIGGVIIMEVDQGIPQGPVRFMSPPWQELFSFVLAEAKRLDIAVTMNNDGGWTGSGGPWIDPAHSMQMVVWSETRAHGPSQFDAVLAQPKTNADYYRDIAVLAFPTPKADHVQLRDRRPTVTANGDNQFDASVLLDGSFTASTILHSAKPEEDPYVQLAFDEPFTAQSVTVGDAEWRPPWTPWPSLRVAVCDDGKAFRTLGEIRSTWPLTCLNFERTSARFFRLTFPTNSKTVHLAEIELHDAPRIVDISGKAGFIRQDNLNSDVPAGLSADSVISRDAIRDITASLDNEGHVRWDVPAGDWTILRFGCTTTGKQNAPAPKESMGLECDKLSKEAVELHFDHLIKKLVDRQKAVGVDSLQATHIDSWEVGSQNWTPRMREEFQKRHNYDLLTYLPTLTGRYVDSAEATERFLWDWRQAIADLVAENYAGHMRELAHRNGLKLSIEAYGDCVFDNMTYAGRCDVPMAEFWVGGGAMPVAKTMSSAAHIYGKPVVAAESFTADWNHGKWQMHPAALKALGDQAFCLGVNRFVVHRYAMQPWLDRWPGMTMGPWGTHFERTTTWWEQSKAWLQYVTRCQYLLQRGHFVADIACLCSEDSPNDPPVREAITPAIPVGYDYDYCSPDVLMTRMRVRDGRLILPDAASYRLLILPPKQTMTPALLTRIRELVEAGATVVGPKPLRSPSLNACPDCDAQVAEIAAELWGDCDGTAIQQHAFGKGRVIWGRSIEQIFADEHLPADFIGRGALGLPDALYLHRTIDGMDVYFVANPAGEAQDLSCAFRIQGRQPQRWNPRTGAIEKLAVYDEANGRTIVPLHLEPHGSVFIVFSPDAASSPDRVTHVENDGKVVMSTDWSHVRDAGPHSAKNITNNFTMMLWVKPDRNIGLPAEATSGVIGLRTAHNDAVYAVPGHEVFAPQGHSGAGISIGRNGVCVYEHAAGYFVPILVHPCTIDHWTHVAIVYQAGRPSLFLNGKLVHTGLQSPLTVHPGMGVPHSRGYIPFGGEIRSPQRIARPLDEADLAPTVAAGVPMAGGEALPALTIVQADGTYQIEATQPGRYVLHTAGGESVRVDVPSLPASIDIAGPWQLTFPPNWVAPERVTLDHLISWPDHSDAGVKYFSGTAVYHKRIDIPAEMLASNHRLSLDLGDVAVIAEVTLNGQPLGILWKPPFVVDITRAARAGENQLDVAVTNLWVNRLIGDEQLPDDCAQERVDKQLKQWPQWLLDGQPSPTGRLTFATWKHYDKDSPLVRSGLLGPVMLRPSYRLEIDRN